MTRIKVIYVASLSHSGSTLLDLLLSHHPDVLGLGEIVNVIGQKKKSGENTEEICSCGESMKSCAFWSKYTPDKDETKIEKYKRILKLGKTFDKEIIVDSSKNLPPLDYLRKMHENKEIELKVIFLLKDVRGWAVSMARAQKRWGNWARPYFHYFMLWYLRNKNMKQYLRKNNIDHIQVGYEEICFNTESILKKIFKFAEIPYDKLGNKPNTHVAYGNRMKLKGKTQIKYDNTWSNKFWLNLTLPLFIPIFLWNKKNTYSNQ